jgi:hypothetical protein
MIYPDHQTANALAQYRQLAYQDEADRKRSLRAVLTRRRQERREKLKAFQKTLILAFRETRGPAANQPPRPRT